jgi:hypothetical protein
LEVLATGSGRINGSGNGSGEFNIWPGIDGAIPHRGFTQPDLKEHEAANLPMGAQVYVRQYDLSDETQLRNYEKVCSAVKTHAMAGRMQFTCVDRHWNTEKNCMVIYLEWIEYFTYSPKESLGRSR